MSVKLKTLTLENFRSFVGEHTIDLDTNGIILLKGPSGSGKSSIALGISYVLGYCPFPATELQSWLTEDPLSVSLTFEAQTPNGVYEVVAKRSPKLSLVVDGIKVKGSATILEEKLQQLLGLSVDVLEALTYRGQRKAGLFLSKSDQEKKEFLSAVVGLSQIERAIEDSNAKKLTLLAQEAVMGEALNSALSDLKRSQEHLDSVQADDPTKTREEILAQEKNLAQEMCKLGDLTNEKDFLYTKQRKLEQQITQNHRENITQIQNKIKDLDNVTVDYQCPPEHNQNVTLLQKIQEKLTRESESVLRKQQEQKQNLIKISNEINKLQNEINKLEKLKTENTRIDKELQALRENVCPTCHQFWLQATEKIQELEKTRNNNDNLLQTIPEKETQLLALKEQQSLTSTPIPNGTNMLLSAQAKLQAAVDQEKQRESQVRQQHYNNLASQRAKYNNEIQQINQIVNEEINTSNQQFKAQLTEITNNLSNKQQLVDKLQRLIQSLKDQLNKVLQNQHNRQILEQQLQQAQARYEEKHQEHQKFVRQVNQELDFCNLIGREGFLGKIFDEILAEISTETNKILSNVNNVASVTVRFASESTTQKGTAKHSIVPIVTVNGVSAPLRSGLSGGMASSVELAVDLAVAEVVARRTGSRLGWLILDEPFDGLGAEDKTSYMAVLQQYATDKLVLVVDHDSTFKETLGRAIEMELVNGQSKINTF